MYFKREFYVMSINGNPVSLAMKKSTVKLRQSFKKRFRYQLSPQIFLSISNDMFTIF